MKDLSILIPARNEMFLGVTIKNILENIEGNTEIIAILDGYTEPIPEIPNDPRVRTLKYDISIGQRSATNAGARLSDAKYLMKTDAHVSFDKGFDVKMLEAFKGHDNCTIIPQMRNLHAFDLVCSCGYREYQSFSKPCPKCGGVLTKEIIWQPRRGTRNNFYRFDKDLHFQYWKEFEKRPEAQADLAPTLSIQGSCFMLTAERYWYLDICEENFGSWGQQGVEVACKTWLSGGEVLTNKLTWYAHMFRTQGQDFGFPYPQSGRQVDHARKYSRELFIGNTWPKAIHSFEWLLEKFAPVPEWHTVSNN